MRLRFKLLLVVASLVLAAAAVFALRSRPAAPDVVFTTLGGERILTADLRGKAVLVNFWATSCVTCVKEMPMLVSAEQKFGQEGYVTVAVAMSYDPPDQVAAFAEKNKLPFKVVLDSDGSIARSFGNVFVTPTTFLLSKKGEIVKQFLGEPNVDWLHAAIAEELSK